MLNMNQIVDGTAFVLDPRSIEETLRNVKAYAAVIPFDAKNKWDMIFFPNGEHDIPLLAARYRTPELGDGQLSPQQAFLLAFLRQLETPRALLNSLPARHRQLYYGDLLGLAPRGARPDQVVVSVELSPTAAEQLLPMGTALSGGQDSQGQPLRYRLDRPLQVNVSRLHDVRWARPAETVGALCHLIESGETLPFPASGVRLFSPQAQEQLAASGRVVAAEILALASGQRTITVTFDSPPVSGTLMGAVSTEKGWLALPPIILTSESATAAFTLTPDQPAIVSPQELDGFNDAEPLLKLSRTDGQQVPAVISIQVQTRQPADIAFSTQDGVSQFDQPSLPFGAEPRHNASISLMAPDWCLKNHPITVTLTPTWQDLPDEGFPAWYAGYPAIPTDNNHFTVTPLALTSAAWEPLIDNEGLPLFQDGTGAPVGANLTFALPLLTCDVVDSIDPADWRSRVRLVLAPHTFLHREYWQQITAGNTLNPPYTPQWASLDISYTSEQDIGINAQYLLTPFGHQAAGDEPDTPTHPQLYLGLRALQPGQQVSLYWKLQSPQPLSVDWQYLNRHNQWHSLNADVLDDTGGLFTSGLWLATLPDDASDQAAQMPTGCYWLRGITALAPSDKPAASVYAREAAPNTPLLQGVLANAMTATLVDPDTVAADHFTQPLPIGSVSQTVESIPGLAGVTQPWASEGGWPAEPPADFNARVARRLSHRGRGARRYDLQTLLMEQFPEVGAVILSAASTPGEQTLTVVPRPGLRDNDDASQPSFSPARLARMANALLQCTSPWVTLTINNPTYVEVTVSFDVTFDAAISPAYGESLLKQALERRYMPWMFDDQADMVAGQQLDYYQLVAFIQQQPYVVSVTRLFLNGGYGSVDRDINELPVFVYLEHPEYPEVATLAGSGLQGSQDGESSAAKFSDPCGIAMDNSGNMFVSDHFSNKIRKITSEGAVTTLAGSSGGWVDGDLTSALFNGPSGMALHADGTLYIADYNNCCIRTISSNSIVGTLAGSQNGCVDGPGAEAKFGKVTDVAIGTDNAIFVADQANHCIRKITLGDGGVATVTTYAGQGGTSGNIDGESTNARFNTPIGICINNKNEVLVADRGNHRIRKIDTDGNVTTIAGSTAGYSDGAAMEAKFHSPRNVACDDDGNIYVAEQSNYRVRKISTDGIVTTVAGSGEGFMDGPSAIAKFNYPDGILVDNSGNIITCDRRNYRIRKIFKR